jgi:hypothetical protein
VSTAHGLKFTDSLASVLAPDDAAAVPEALRSLQNPPVHVDADAARVRAVLRDRVGA